MTATSDFVVIGAGMMGAPCARHLAEAGHSVALIAAPETRQGPGPRASHWDAGRITRRVASDPDWSLLSRRSIARYRDLEARSGERFFGEVGAVMAGLREGPLTGFTDGLLTVAEGLDDPRPSIGPDGHGWTLPPGSVASHERRLGGWIDPRAAARAQIACARDAGCVVHHGHAVARDGAAVTLADGTRLSGGHVVVATGPHAASDGLLPGRPRLTVWGRTVAFVRVSEAEAARLADLPTCIWVPGPDWDHDLYALPPIRYPDGRHYLKIGGEVVSPVLHDAEAIRAWYATPGDAAVGERLLAALRLALPGLAEAGTHTESCAVVWSDTGYPYVDAAGPGVTVLCGGNGAAAKSGDEIGRLGAVVASGGSLDGEGYAADFRAVWD
ncbi:FAD-binding oxidoreductase [Jannaschia sp. LMIT008]|uniref:FAD-binding oxidoreductase n=1 Tax=Jannaschia maritima TaxID=3032585 RepID=UPI00281211C9|nr:FAD-binding oxidoreductase [Jannaschia sp. LMIT008]